MACDTSNGSLYGINQTNCSMPNVSTPASCSDDTTTENLIFSIYLVVVLIFTVAGNSLVVAVVIAYERLRQVTNFFIVSLAVADLLFATLSLPFNIYQTLNNNLWCGNLATCTLYLIIDAGACGTSMSNLAAISVDRLVAICKPFRYSDIFTKKKAILVISVVWAYGMFFGIILLVDFENADRPHISYEDGVNRAGCRKQDAPYATVTAILSFFFPLVIVIFSYSIIFRVALTQAKAVSALDPNRNQRKRTTFFREVKATKVVALVIGAFVLCWLPLFVITMAVLWDTENAAKFARNHPNAQQFIYWTFLRVLPPLNSCINPFIYCLFNSHFRSAFAKFLHIPKRRSREMEHTMVTTDTTYQDRPCTADNDEHAENGI